MVNDFKEKFKTDGEYLVKESLHLSKVPDVTADLNIPVPDPSLYYNDVDEPHSKKRKMENSQKNNVDGISGTHVMVLPNGMAPCNKKLATLAETVKPMIRELIDHANTLKMWISLQIPKIEDGNNFGVSVQEESLGEARQVESEAASYLDQISRYFITRAKIVSKVAKYPHIVYIQYRTSKKITGSL
ncbi:hypothetical protein KUTeg_008175 [Tegillarca granosa]|uniref:Proteasome activator PA28 C-terminal domain-containing protein n=1 Tax=Tegillarca granosa TaxID=220873 RepID=A0ABQ9F8E0_TEGGR|nr:hypothetical protein KUTeg_008175 [Tegillarca granosa]